MAEAKKPTVKKAAAKKVAPTNKIKKAELVAEVVVENEAPEVKIDTKVKSSEKTRAAGSELMQEEDAQRSELYSNTESEQGKDSTPQEAESDDSVDSSADEKVSASSSSGTAKAGKRSPKAQKEAEQKEAKEAKKADTSTSEKPKEVKQPVRSRVERAGKKYRELAKQVDKDKIYSLKDALELAVKTSPSKFDATVEMHINLNVDPRQADQNVRDNVILPAGTGKTVRIAVMGDEDEAKAAKTAGADIAGTETLTALLEKEQIDFDVLIATPTQMPKLGKYARLLGPRGLMPNPKSGTVTTDITKAVNEAKAGKVEYRVDQAGIVHLGIGKVSFGADKLATNADVIVASIKSAKPASVKGGYIKASYLTTTMGPSIKFEL